jgi:hypothetical protein
MFAGLLIAGVVHGSAEGATRSSPCSVIYPSDAGVPWRCDDLRAGETMMQVFGDRWIDVARFNRIDRRHAEEGVRLKIPEALGAIQDFTPLPNFYAAAEPFSKYLLVDLTEQFIGAYEFGWLRFSAPITSGEASNETPVGEFAVTAAHARHASTLYTIEGTAIPYPMTFALLFHETPAGVAYWIHGRDLPGVPASHGCIGLYDEMMQQEQYGTPAKPVLDDARRLYVWVTGESDHHRLIRLHDGPKLRIIGSTPAPASPTSPAGAAGCK